MGVVGFVLLLGWLERMGLTRTWIGYIFLLATVVLYAAIGVLSRTTDAAEYYVAGRRVPAIFNGMATAADWMSAASFIGLAGTLYLQGYTGLAFIMGWTGGYVLVALFLAPYLRKFGQYTIPDFLGARYAGHAARSVGVVVAIMCSFVYLVAQIYGVGLITSALTVRYRDVSYLVPFVLQFLLFASPIAYAISNVPSAYLTIYEVNPLTWLLQEYQWGFLNQPAPALWEIVLSIVVPVAVFIGGAIWFEQLERSFADVI